MTGKAGGRGGSAVNPAAVFDWSKVTLRGAGGLSALMEMALHRDRR